MYLHTFFSYLHIFLNFQKCPYISDYVILKIIF